MVGTSAPPRAKKKLKERDDLPEGHVVIVIGWKENLSLPLAGTELSTMLWTSERMDVSCFGAAVYQNYGGAEGTYVKYGVYLTDILDHTALMSSVMLDRARELIDRPGRVAHISIWADCGPHFRAY